MELTALTFPATCAPTQGTIVLLHGWGADDQDLQPIAQELDRPDCQFVFPNATFAHPAGGRMWYKLGPQLELDRDPQGIATSRAAIIALLERITTDTKIPLSRTVLVGFSQGGAMALDVGTRLPLAGIVSLSGYLHGELTVAAATPVLIMHGTHDPVVPFAAAVQVQAALKHAGIAVEFHDFAIAHSIYPEEIGVLRDFLLRVLA